MVKELPAPADDPGATPGDAVYCFLLYRFFVLFVCCCCCFFFFLFSLCFLVPFFGLFFFILTADPAAVMHLDQYIF